MLLEVRWAQGRLLREYTVLLDPPVFEAPVAAPAQPAPAAPAQPAPRPIQRPAPAAAPAPAPSQPAPSLSSAPAGSFGPVQRNDTLWNIATRTRPDPSITINQMMLAIYDANPEAFDGNINRLRAGAILRIPSANEAAQRSQRDAFAEVSRQNDNWSGSVPAAAGDDSARLRLVPPADDAGAQAPGSSGTAAGGAASDARVAELEAELAERERMLQFKDQQLADLQDQLAAMQAEAAAARAESMADADAALDAAPIGAAPIEQAPVDEAPMAETPAEEAPVAESPPGEAAEPEEPGPARAPPPAVSQPAEEPSFIGELLTNPFLYLGLVLALLAGLFVARRRRSDDSAESWKQPGMGEELDAGAGEGTGGIEAPVREMEDAFVVEESPATPGTDALERAVDADATVKIDPDRAADQELPLEKTLSSDSALNLDQSDPLAEAEFHSAYGLYDQAADLLNAALEAEPERMDLRRKLIEVYFSWDNRGGFQKAAEDYHERIDEGDQFWNKVLVMGKQLCPDEPLFAAVPLAPVTGDEMDLALTDEAGGDVDLDLGDEDVDVDLDLSGIRPMPEDAGLDFDLGDVLMDEDSSPTEQQEFSADAPTMETPTMEAPGPGASTMETPTIEAPGPGAQTMESPTLEQPAVEPTMETPTIETPAADLPQDTDRTSDTAALDLDELGLDIGEFDELVSGDVATSGDDETLLASDSELDDAALLAAGAAGLDSTAEVESLTGDLSSEDAVDAFLAGDATAEQPGPDLDALRQAMDKQSGGEAIGDTAEQPRPEVDETAEQPSPVPDLAISAEDSAADERVDFDIGDQVTAEEGATGTLDKPARGREGPTMTEVGTKLDLARAYIDMGDPEGARSILGEVVEEGDEPQRQEAQRLLDTLTA
jgi:pilus assembly protein FimV